MCAATAHEELSSKELEEHNPFYKTGRITYFNVVNVDDDANQAEVMASKLEKAAKFIDGIIGMKDDGGIEEGDLMPSSGLSGGDIKSSSVVGPSSKKEEEGSNKKDNEEKGGSRVGGGAVLVHCAAGISRSTTLVLYYLLTRSFAQNLKARKDGHTQKSMMLMTLRDCFAYVKARRPVIWPNKGFMAQLIHVEKKLFGSASMTMQEYEEWTDFDPDAYESAKIVDRKEN